MRVSLLGLAVLAAGVLLCVAALVASDRGLKTVGTASASAAGQETMLGWTWVPARPRVRSRDRVSPELHPRTPPSLPKRITPYPAALPPLTPGDVVKVHMVLKDVTIEIAPGVKYAAWGFEGGAPGPVVHARQGQTVEMTLTNDGAIPHSIDFHAARIAPNKAFVDVMPGQVVHVPLQGRRPRRVHVPLRHEAGADAHRQRHVRRDRRRPRDAAPEGRPLLRARRKRVVPERATASPRPPSST